MCTCSSAPAAQRRVDLLPDLAGVDPGCRRGRVAPRLCPRRTGHAGRAPGVPAPAARACARTGSCRSRPARRPARPRCSPVGLVGVLAVLDPVVALRSKYAGAPRCSPCLSAATTLARYPLAGMVRGASGAASGLMDRGGTVQPGPGALPSVGLQPAPAQGSHAARPRRHTLFPDVLQVLLAYHHYSVLLPILATRRIPGGRLSLASSPVSQVRAVRTNGVRRR